MGRKRFPIIVEPRNLAEALLSPLVILSEINQPRDYYIVIEDYEDEEFLEEVMEEIDEDLEYLEESGLREFLREMEERNPKPNI
ncbi:MAG: hypothetical protein QXW71_05830 [Thermoplasmata archaeon]